MSRPICDFVVAGSMRSGSSSLNRYLSDHPQVFMVRPKEPHFFDVNHAKGLGWYADLFADAPESTRRGETTPAYLAHHAAFPRMTQALPDIRVVAVLRDPVDRAFSHYWMRVATGRESRSFEEVVRDELHVRDDMSLMWQSRYANHLGNLFDHVAPERCLLVSFDDLQHRPQMTMRFICRFIGVDGHILPPSVGSTVNASFRARSERLRRWGKAPFVPKRMQNAIAKLNQKEVEYPEMEPALRMELDDLYQPDREAALRAIADTFTTIRLSDQASH